MLHHLDALVSSEVSKPSEEDEDPELDPDGAIGTSAGSNYNEGEFGQSPTPPGADAAGDGAAGGGGGGAAGSGAMHSGEGAAW